MSSNKCNSSFSFTGGFKFTKATSSSSSSTCSTSSFSCQHPSPTPTSAISVFGASSASNAIRKRTRTISRSSGGCTDTDSKNYTTPKTNEDAESPHRMSLTRGKAPQVYFDIIKQQDMAIARRRESERFGVSTPTLAVKRRASEGISGSQTPVPAKRARPCKDSENANKNKTYNMKLVFPLNGSSKSEDSQGHFESIDFHPKAKLAMLASNASVFIHRVDGKENKIVKEYKFIDSKIKRAIFVNEGREIWMITENSKCLFRFWNIRDGRMEEVSASGTTAPIMKFIRSPTGEYVAGMLKRGIALLIISVSTKEVVASLAETNEFVDAAFDKTGALFTISKIGEINKWDIAAGVVQDSYLVGDNYKGLSIAVSEQFVACGLELGTTGMVNLYSRLQLKGGCQPEVIKSFAEIKSPTHLKFNCDGNFLAIATNSFSNSFQLVHIPDMTTECVNLSFTGRYGHCGDIAFSPNGGFFAFGYRARTSLYKLNKYELY